MVSKSKKLHNAPWIVAARTDGFGARMCALLNAMVFAKLTKLDFKFAWIPPQNAPFLSEWNKNLENNQVLIPFANLPLKEELFSKKFIEKHGISDSYIGNIEQILNYPQVESLQRYTQSPYPIDFGNGNVGWYVSGSFAHQYKDLDNELYKKTLAQVFGEIDFSDSVKKTIEAAKKSVSKIKGDFVAIHIRSGDIVYADTWAPIVVKETALSVYLALEMTKIELQHGNSIVLFSDDLNATKQIQKILSKDSKNAKVYCIDDFFKRENYAGYEQSIFEITFMSKAKKICNGGSSGFSGLAMHIGNIQEHKNPNDYFTLQEQIEIIESSLAKDDFHPAHRAFASFWLFLEEAQNRQNLKKLEKHAEFSYQQYPQVVYKIAYLAITLANQNYAVANALLEQIYHSDTCEDFMQRLFGSVGYPLFRQIFALLCGVYDLENYPYISYFAYRVGIYTMANGIQPSNIEVVLNYMQNYHYVANFLLKIEESGKFKEIYPTLKRLEITIVSNAFRELKELKQKVIPQ